jgi:hypothetical protein
MLLGNVATATTNGANGDGRELIPSLVAVESPSGAATELMATLAAENEEG